MLRFYSPDNTDKRMIYAKTALEKSGYICVEKEENANFIMLGVNPDEKLLSLKKPIFAGHVEEAKGIFDYTKNEAFALKNAYLTAEAALSLAIKSSPLSLINSSVLICGFGRIGKALLRYLEPFTRDITICLRNENAAAAAKSEGARVIGFNELKNKGLYHFVFNTVPHPVFNEEELKALKKGALLIDLASFPGGVDEHYAKKLDINYISARGLPGKYSPESAGEIVAQTVINTIDKEGL